MHGAQMTSFTRESPDDLAAGQVVLQARCGGRDGKCGKLRAIAFDDRTIRYFPSSCHNFDEYFHERDEVIDAFLAACRELESARRSREPFRPKVIAVRPLVRHLRI